MSKLFVTKATTSKTILVFIQDSSSTTGAGLAGLAWNTASLSWFYYREEAGTGGTQVTLATQTLGTWATGGFVEIDAADLPGWYELGIPDAVLATGVDFVGMQLKGATNMAQLNIELQLTNFDVNDGVRGGMTALPNAAADAAGGVVISVLGGVDMDQIADILQIQDQATVRGICVSGSTTTVIKTNFTEDTDNHYNGGTLIFLSGSGFALGGQRTGVSDYGGTGKELTVVQLTEAPASGDKIVIV